MTASEPSNSEAAGGDEQRVRLSNVRMSFLRKATRSLEPWWDAGLRSQLNFCFKTSYATVSLLNSVISELVSTEDVQEIESWLDEGPLEPLPDLPAERNPELEARCRKLRAQLENKLYRDMVKNVSPAVKESVTQDMSSDFRAVNRQLTVVANMLLTVIGAFVFGYKGLGIAMPSLDLGIRLIVGSALATLVFFADLYFVVAMMET